MLHVTPNFARRKNTKKIAEPYLYRPNARIRTPPNDDIEKDSTRLSLTPTFSKNSQTIRKAMISAAPLVIPVTYTSSNVSASMKIR